MMRPKSILLLALALGCGLVASIGISQVLDGKNQNAPVESVPIYVALQNINLGDKLDDTMVSLQEWPKDKVPVGAITKWEEIEDRRPRAVIFQGEPLLDSKLLEKGQSNDPISAIPTGMRLKTVSVDARKSAAGLLSPGDRVDVQIFVRRNEREEILHSFTKTFLQNIRVFAVDQAVQRLGDGTESRAIAKTVSLIVTPEQANRITTAENFGEISLIPRHPDDDAIVDDSETPIDFLTGRSSANNRELEQGVDNTEPEPVVGFEAVAEVDATPPFQMKIIYPNEVSILNFSPETGEPLDDGSQQNGSQQNDAAPVKNAKAEKSDDNTDTDTGTSEEADFPIDLRRK